MDLEERLMRHIKINPDTGCWEWQAHLNKKGYGVTSIDGRATLAHRAMYELHFGPAPTDLVIDHRCRVRCCLNPEHLELVTQHENVLRGTGWAGNNARKTHCPQGHPYDEVNTVKIGKDKHHRRCRACQRAEGLQSYYRRRATKPPQPRKIILKSHCIHGHPYDEENTGYYSKRRFCRTCARRASREYQRTHPKSERRARKLILPAAPRIVPVLTAKPVCATCGGRGWVSYTRNGYTHELACLDCNRARAMWQTRRGA